MNKQQNSMMGAREDTYLAITSLKKFKLISTVIRFGDRKTRQRRSNDKFATIRELWDKWVKLLPRLFNPEACVIDVQLVNFRGNCPFKQPNKPAKCGVKFSILCDNDYEDII